MSEKYLHIIPLNDLKEHTTDGTGVCDCLPKYKDQGSTTLVIHNSWDNREYFDQQVSKNVIPL